MGKRLLPTGAYFQGFYTTGLPKIDSMITINGKSKRLGRFMDILSPHILYQFVRNEIPKYDFNGKNNPMYGKRGNKNPLYKRPLPKEVKYKLSIANSGKNNYWYGKKRSKKTCDLMSKSQIREKNHQWKGGISFEPYCPKFNKQTKEMVREHFNNECVLCNKTEEMNKRKLAVHHVNYNKGQGCSGEWLLVPLCDACHRKTNFNREYWETYFTNYLMEYHDFKCGVD